MQKYKKLLVFALIIGVSFYMNAKYDLASYFTDEKKLNSLKVFVERQHGLAALIYVAFTSLASSILALPGASFAIISSFLFGVYLGSLYCLIGISLGALFAFFLSRYLIKDYVKSLLVKNKRLYDILYELNPEKEWLVLMITRLLPIFPFNLQNYAYGLTDISVLKYTVGTFVFTIPGIFLFSLATRGFMAGKDRSSVFIAVGLIITFLLILSYFLYKKYKTIRDKDIKSGL